MKKEDNFFTIIGNALKEQTALIREARIEARKNTNLLPPIKDNEHI